MLGRIVLPIVAVFAFGFAVVQMTKAQQQPPPATPPMEPARSPFFKQLAGAGLIEPETENISVGTHVPGIVDAVYVRVGQTVQSGDPLFHLDARHLNAERMVREAALANSEANVAKLLSLPREEELPPVLARITELEANLSDQMKMYERLKPLAGNVAVSDDEFTRREMAVSIARAQLEQARAELALLKAGVWKPDLKLAEANVQQMKAQLQQTITEIERLTVRAPQLSKDTSDRLTVLQVNVRPGEFVGTVQGQALVVLGHLKRLHVRVDIDENDIYRFRNDLKGVAKPRGNPNVEYPVHFVRVEPYVIPKRSLTGANTERVDTRVLQVIYSVEATDDRLFVGQQMDVFLDTEEP